MSRITDKAGREDTVVVELTREEINRLVLEIDATVKMEQAWAGQPNRWQGTLDKLRSALDSIGGEQE